MSRSALRGRILRSTTFLTGAIACLAGPAYAQAGSTKVWQPRSDLHAQTGTRDNNEVAVELFVPMAQNDETLLYSAARIGHNEQFEENASLTLGLRKIVGTDLALGINIGADIYNSEYSSRRRSAASIGLEAFTSAFDLHLNFHAPLSSERTFASVDPAATGAGALLIENNRLIERRTGFRLDEIPLKGVNGEIGYTLPVSDKTDIRLSGGGFRYQDEQAERHVGGQRGGLELTMRDIGWEGARFSIGADVQDDNRYGTQVRANARLSIPLGSSRSRTSQSRLQRQMGERVRRDFVAPSGTRNTSLVLNSFAIDARTGNEFGGIYYVNGTAAAGAGTLTNPTTLADAVTRSGQNGVSVVLGGAGDATAAGVTLVRDQYIVGGASNVDVRLTTGATTQFGFGGTNGIVRGTAAAGSAITLGPGSVVRDVTVRGAGTGISGSGVGGFRLDRVTIEDTGSMGLSLANTSGAVVIDGLTVRRAGGTGVSILGGSSVTLRNSTIGGGAGAIRANDGGAALALSLSNLTLSSTGGTVLDLSGAGAGTLTVNALSGLTIAGGRGETGGFSATSVAFDSDPLLAGLQALDAGRMVVGTAVSRVTGPGVALTDVTGSLTFADLDIANSGATGLRVVNSKVNDFLLTTLDGTIDTVGGTAIDMDPLRINLILASVGSSGAAGAGIIFDTVTGSGAGGSAANIGTLTVANSGQQGLFITGGSTGLFTIGGGLIGGSGGSAIQIGEIGVAGSGGTIGLNFGGTVTHGSNTALLSISEHSAGAVAVTGNLGATGGSGLQFDNADGSYSFTGTNALNGGDAGIDILNGSGGAFTFGAGTTILNSSAGAFRLLGSSASVTFGGTIGQSGAGPAVSLGGSSGTIGFTGAITSSGSSLLNLGSTGTIGGTISFTGALTGTGGIVVGNTLAGSSVKIAGPSLSGVAGNAISLNGIAGSLTFTGTTTIDNPGGAGIVVGAVPGGVVFGDVNVTGLGPNTTGVNLRGTQGNVVFRTLDIVGASTTGTRGIDLTGSTNSGTVLTQDSGTVTGVGIGVDLTNASIGGVFRYGDGSNTDADGAASTIGAVIPLVITGLNGAAGSYNFADVNLVGDVSALKESGATIYYVLEGANGDGSRANPGSLAGGDNSSAQYVVLLNNPAGGQDVLDAATSGGAFDINPGQRLVSFLSTDFIATAGGLPANLIVQGIGPFGIQNLYAGSGAPILTTTALNTSTVAMTANSMIDGLIIANQSSGYGVAIVGAANAAVANSNISGVAGALDIFANGVNTSATLTNLNLSSASGTTLVIDGSGAGTTTVSGSGINITATGSAAALNINTASLPSLVLGGIDVGTSAGPAISIANTTGSIELENTSIAGTSSGAGVLISNSGADIIFDNLTVAGTAGDAVHMTGNSGEVDLGFVNIAASNGSAIHLDSSSGFTGVFSGTITQSGTSDAVSINGLSGTALFALPIVNTGSGSAVSIDNSSGGVLFFAPVTSSGGGDVLTIGTTGFNGFALFTDTLTASGGGGIRIENVSIPGQVILSNVAVSDSASVAISLANIDGSVTFGGATSIDNPGATGIALGGGSSGNITFGDVVISGLADNTTGLDARTASGNVRFDTLNIFGASTTNTRGIDLTGATFAGAVRTLESGIITGVGIGVDLTNAAITGLFRYGDGSNTDADGAASTISATTPLVIAGINGATGSYDFNDVNLVGDTTPLSTSATIYWVEEGKTGAGTKTDPGSLAGAEASGAQYIVLLNNVAGGQDTLDAVSAGGSFDLAAGQTLLSFLNQDLFALSGGAPVNVQLFGIVQGLTNPYAGSGAPVLTTTAGGGAATIILGGNTAIDGVIIANGGSGAGILASGVSGNIAIDGSQISAGSGMGLGIIAGGALNITGAGSTISTTTGTIIDIANSTANTVFFDVSFANASGAAPGTGISISNTGTGSITGTLSIGGGVIGSTIAATLRGIDLYGDSLNFTYGGDIYAGGLGAHSVEATNRTGGTATFSGNINDTGSGINIADNLGGTLVFSGASKNINTGANAGINLVNNSASTAVEFIGGGLDIDTTSGTGLSVSGGGALTVSGLGNSITTNSGTIIDISNSGAAALVLDAVFAAGANGLGATGISIANTGAGSITGTLNIGSGAITASVRGVELDGDNLEFTYGGDITVAGLAARSVDAINRTGGTATFSGNIDDSSSGIRSAFSTGGALIFSGASKKLNVVSGNALTVNGNSAGTSVSFINGGLQVSGEGIFQFGDGDLTISGAGNTILTETGTGVLLNGGNGIVDINADITTIGGGRSVTVANRSVPTVDNPGIVTFSGNIDNTNGAGLGMLFVNNGDGAQIVFSGTSNALTTGAGAAAITVSGSGSALLSFINGGLVINTDAGNGISHSGGTNLTISGIGNTITTATGIGVRLSNGAGNVDINSSVSTTGGYLVYARNRTGTNILSGDLTSSNGGATFAAITANNIDGSLSLGNVAISNPGQTGIEFGTGSAGTISFGDVDIVGLGANRTAVDARNASGTVVFNTLDIAGASSTGTRGINLTGAAYAGSFTTTDSGTITGVGIGVDLTNAAITGSFQYGDGSNTDPDGAASTINATTPIVIAGLNGAIGTYNFADVNLVGDVSGLASSATLFFVEQGKSGIGTAADPGSLSGAEASGAQYVVLLNNDTDSVDDTIDAAGAGGSFDLDAGQNLISFLNGDIVPVSGGAPNNIILYGITPGVVSNPYAGSGAPTLDTSTGGGASTLVLGGGNIVDGVIIANSATGLGIYATGNGTSVIRNSQVSGANGAIDFQGSATDSVLSLQDLQLSASGGTILNVRKAGAGLVTVTDLSGLTINRTGTEGGALVFDGVIFDADITTAGYQTVDAGALTIGTLAGRVAGAGLAFTQVDGSLAFSNLNIATTGNISLNIANIAGNDFTLAIANGSVDNDNGAGFVSRVATLDVNLASLSSLYGQNAILLEDAQGSFTIAGGVTATSFNAGIALQNNSVLPLPLAVTFQGAVAINNASSFGSGAILNGNAGTTVSFLGGLNINSGNAASFAASGGNVTVAGATNSLASFLSAGLQLTNITVGSAGLNFATVNASPAFVGIVINNVDQVAGSSGIDIGGGAVAMAFPFMPAVEINGGSADIDIGAAINSGFAASIIGRTGGTVTLSGAINASGDTGVLIDGVGAGATVALTGASTFTGGSAGITVSNVAATGTVTVAAPTLTNVGGSPIALTNIDGTVTFTGTTSISNPGTSGIRLGAGSTGTIAFGDVDITNLAANRTGLDARAAEGTVSLNTLDVTGASAVGTRGIDLRGAAFAGSVTTLDSGTITGVGIGVDLTNAAITGSFQYGDGSNTDPDGAASTINATTPIVIAGLNGAIGTYNFADVNLVGDTSNLASTITFYWVEAGASGVGTRADPGSLAGAEAAAASYIVLLNNDLDSIDDTLDAGTAGGTLNLDSGQGLVAFGASDTLNLGSAGGAPANMILFNIDNSGIVTNKYANSGAPILTTTSVSAATVEVTGGNTLTGLDLRSGGAGAVILGTAISGIVTVDNSTIATTTGYGLTLNGGAGTVTVNAPITVSGTGRSVYVNGRTGGAVTVSGAISGIGGGGIQIAGNTGGSVTFSGPATLTTGAGAALSVSGNSAGTSLRFDQGGLVINTIAGAGLLMSGGGNLSIAGPGNSITTISGTGVSLSGGDGTIDVNADIITLGSGFSASIANRTGGTATFSGTITSTNGTGQGIRFLNNLNGAQATFSGGSKAITTSGSTTALTISGSGSSSLSFTNGGLQIATAGGNGINLSGGANLTISGANNTVATATGLAVRLFTGTGNATINSNVATTGAGSLLLASGRTGTDILSGTLTSSNGGGTAITLTNIDGSLSVTGLVTIDNPGGTGILFGTGSAGTITFGDVDIGQTIGLAANRTGVDARLASGTISFNTLDIKGASNTGTKGIDLTAANYSGSFTTVDSGTITGVGIGVDLTNAAITGLFRYGDGSNADADGANSNINASTPIVIAGMNGATGTYNFADVNLVGNTANLSVSAFFVEAGASGSGTSANPGSLAAAEASSATYIVLLNNVAGGNDTIDAATAGGSFDLDAGQQLLSFLNQDSFVVPSVAPANLILFNVPSGTISNPYPGSGAPTLNTSTGGGASTLVLGGGDIVDGLIIANGATGLGIYSSGGGTTAIRNSQVSGANGAISVSNGAAVSALSLQNLVLSAGGGTILSLANPGAGSLTVTGLSGLTLLGGNGETNGFIANTVTFDSNLATPGIQAVNAGAAMIGTVGARVGGSGLRLTNVSGALSFTPLNIANNGGTGLQVANSKANSFLLTTVGGTVDTVGGTAIDLDPLTLNMVLSSVTSSGGAYALWLNQVGGSFAVTGAVTGTNVTGAGLRIDDSAATVNLANLNVSNAAQPGGGILVNHAIAGTLGLTIGGGALSTSSGTPVSIVNSGAGTVNLGVALGSVSSSAAAQGFRIENTGLGSLTGTLAAIGGAITASADGAYLNGGTYDFSYGGSLTTAGAFANSVEIVNRASGTATFSGNITDTGHGINIANVTGGTITFSGASKVLTPNAWLAVNILNSAGSSVRFAGGGLQMNATGPSGALNMINGGNFEISGGNNSGTAESTAVIYIDGGNGTVDIDARIQATLLGDLATIKNRTGGAVTLSGDLGTFHAGVSHGLIDVQNNLAGSVTFSGASKLLGPGLVINGNSASSSVSFTNGGLEVYGPIQIFGGGSINVYGSTNFLSSTNDQLLEIVNASANALTLDMTFASATQSVVSGGTRGIRVSKTGSGAVTGTLNVLSGAIFSAVHGIELNGDALNFTYGGTVQTSAAAARSIEITNRTGGSATFSGNITDTGLGINIANNPGGSYLFSGGSKVLNTGANNALTISGNGATAGITFTQASGTGLDIDTSTGAGISASGAGNLTVFGPNNTITTVAGTGVSLNNATGTININAAIGTTGAGLLALVQNQTAGTATLSGNLNTTATGLGILVQNNVGGTTTFSGGFKVINTGANNAVQLLSNNGATVNFTGGGLDIDTTTGTGFLATGGGTFTVQGTGNSITSVSGTALNVANTNIGASNATFQLISSGAAANVGISLDNTGSSGGLIVTGNGGAGTGGTIAGKTGADGSTTSGIGIYLNNTTGVSLSRMQLNGFDNFAIRGFNVTGFELKDSVINGINGNNDAVDEASIRFDNLWNTGLISNSTVSGAVETNIRVINTSGTLNALQIINSSIRDNSATTGGDGIFARASTGAIMVVKITGSTFQGNRDDHIQTDAEASSSMTTVVSGNTFTSNGTVGAPATASTLGGGITITGGATYSGSSTYNVSNNVITGAKTAAVTINIVNSTASGSLSGTINNNTIGQAGSANSGSSSSDGISVIVNGAGTLTATITNNQIRQFNNIGIQLIKRDGSGNLNATITGNTIAEPVSPNALQGILVTSGATSGPPQDSGTVWLDIGGAGALANTVTGPNFGGDLIRVRQRFDTDVKFTGYVGAANDTVAATNYLNSRNNITNEGANAKVSVTTQAPGSITGDPAAPPAGALPLP